MKVLRLLVLGCLCAGPVLAAGAADDLAKSGLAKWQKNDERGAVEDFMEALTLDPNNLAAHLNYSYVLISGGRLAEAKPYVDKYASLSGYESASTYYLLAKYNLAAGNDAAALIDLDKVLMQSPGIADAHLEKAMLLARHGEHKKALLSYDEALHWGASTPGFAAKAMAARAESLVATNQVNKALKDYDSVIASDPKESRYYAARAQLLKKKNYPQAVRDSAVAIALNPDDADSRFALGILLMEDKNQKIRAMDSLYMAANLYARKGQRDNLLQTMEIMSRLDPRSPLVERLYFLAYPEIVGDSRPYEAVDSGFTRDKMAQNRKGF